MTSLFVLTHMILTPRLSLDHHHHPKLILWLKKLRLPLRYHCEIHSAEQMSNLTQSEHDLQSDKIFYFITTQLNKYCTCPFIWVGVSVWRLCRSMIKLLNGHVRLLWSIFRSIRLGSSNFIPLKAVLLLAPFPVFYNNQTHNQRCCQTLRSDFWNSETRSLSTCAMSEWQVIFRTYIVSPCGAKRDALTGRDIVVSSVNINLSKRAGSTYIRNVFFNKWKIIIICIIYCYIM